MEWRERTKAVGASHRVVVRGALDRNVLDQRSPCARACSLFVTRREQAGRGTPLEEIELELCHSFDSGFFTEIILGSKDWSIRVRATTTAATPAFSAARKAASVSVFVTS